jgi:hypothetical protein
MMSLHSALRAQLGVAVPALSIPREVQSGSEPCLLFFGIVDFLQVRTHSPAPAAALCSHAPIAPKLALSHSIWRAYEGTAI